LRGDLERILSSPSYPRSVTTIRPCREDERVAIFEIVNAAAVAYRGVIPADCWHEPYMPERELEDEIAAGVSFWGYETDGGLAGVMGLQRVREVELIRHAYVRPADQGRGVGTALLQHLRERSSRPMLVGTWAAAHWAINFYCRHGFELIPADSTAAVLRRYWTISARQIETSVVLADARFQSDA
jgi:GNAT superfamily N-acetyltransferase